MQRFCWLPGVGVDAIALERLRSHFRQPSSPMGEAWFMSEERGMFPELMGDLSSLSAFELQTPLAEIASGTSCFGPLEEWDHWYHYLLGQLLPRSHEAHVTSLLELLITGFCALHPNGIQRSPYEHFRSDVLNTLGRCMMDPRCWSEGGIVIGSMLHRSNNNPARVWCWWNASGDFSASMFLCLKYLPPSIIPDWLASVLAISSPHWRAQVLVWFVGSHELLRGRVRWPSEFEERAYPSVDWNWSHCLGPQLTSSDTSGAEPVESFLPSSTREVTLAIAQQFFTEDVFLAWLESIHEIPYLVAELASIPSAFESIYVRARQA